jgi:hypothetical protein
MADSDDEITQESLAREFPAWEIWKGVTYFWYARKPLTSPPIVERGEDLTDLRDQMIRKMRQLGQLDEET